MNIVIEYDINEDEHENLNLSVYDVNPSICVTNAYIETPYSTSNLWHITGFIDMDYKFFDYSKGYKFFMKDKSFDMHINIPNIIKETDKQVIYNCKCLRSLLNISNISMIIQIKPKQIIQ